MSAKDRPKSNLTSTPASKPNPDTFRRVDVDRYDENRYQDEAGDEGTVGVGLNEQEITNFLNQNKPTEALKRLVEQVPSSGAKNAAAREKAIQLAVRAMAAIRHPAQIDEALKAVCGGSPAGATGEGPASQLDVLMKYVYRGMEVCSMPSGSVSPMGGQSSAGAGDTLATLLLWHERIFSSGGHGCIIRVLTDRRRL